MRETRWLRLVAVAMLAALAFSACGGGDDGEDGNSEGNGEATEQVSTEDYVAGLCSSMVDWQNKSQELSSTLQQEVQADPSMSMPDRKERIATYLENLKTETETFISSVEDAGEPDVEGGADVADTLLSGFRELITVIEQGQEQVAQLPTDDAETFRTQTDLIGDSLEAGFNQVAAGFQQMGGTPIDAAIKEEESCQQIQTAP